ncbi:MAG TPA: hypothetical protein DGN60_07540 [Chloroflexi bacterium]|nr:hypothetical protein [Chloroflexota bacterium]
MLPLIRKIQVNKTIIHICILLLLWILFFWRFFADGPNRVVFPDGDFTQQFFMFRTIAFRQLLSGNIPLWTDCFFGGYPFHADPQAQLFYPPVLLNFGVVRLLGYDSFPMIALTVETILHYLAISIFGYLFLKEECGSRIGALSGSIILTYGGYLTGYPPLQTASLETATWMPLILLALRRFVSSESGPAIAGVIFAYSLAFFAGHPQTFLLIIYLSIAYFLYRSIVSGRTLLWIVSWTSIMFGLLTLTVGVQLFPQIQFLALSTRSSLPFDELSSGFATYDIVQFFVTRLVSTDLWQPLYIGIMGITFALIALPLKRDGPVRFWLGTALVSLLVSFGSNLALYQMAYWLLPVFKLFRGQERAAVVIAMASSVLVSLTVSAITGPLKRKQRAVLFAALRWVRNLVPVAIILLIIAVVAAQNLPEVWGHIPARLGLLVIGMVLTVFVLTIRPLRRIFPVALIFVISIELFSANISTNAYAPFDPYPELSLIKPIQLDSNTDRWFRTQDDARMQGHWACAYGLREWGGISPIRLQTWVDFDALAPEHTRFRMLGIDYLISWKMQPMTREGLLLSATPIYQGMSPSGDAKVYRLPWQAQRAWLTETAYGLTSASNMWKIIQSNDFEPYKVALTLSSKQTIDSTGGNVKIISDRPGYIELAVNNKDESLLVFSEAWYPGWTATTNGIKQPTEMVNGYIQGAHLENPGPQKVVLEYDPLLLRQGLTASIIGLVLTLSLCFWKKGYTND